MYAVSYSVIETFNLWMNLPISIHLCKFWWFICKQNFAHAQNFKLDCLKVKIHRFYWSSCIKNGLTFEVYMHYCVLWDSSCSTVLANTTLLRYISTEEAYLKVLKFILPSGQVKRIFSTHLKLWLFFFFSFFV